jgi:hypothetical protein
MAGNIKDQLIAEFRSEDDLTPGVVEFLSAAIPDPPEITTPTDVDAAIIANGIAAKYVLDLFKPFAGLTPVEMVLHIGQLNTVLQGAYLAGLEYINASGAQNGITIVMPEDGHTYLPGDLALKVQVSSGIADRMTATIGTQHTTLTAAGETWTGTLTITPGEYTLAVTATFTAGADATASRSFTCAAATDGQLPADQPEPPGGSDAPALQTALDACDAEYRKFMSMLNQTADHNAWNAAYQTWKSAIDAFVRAAVAAVGQSVLTADLGYLQQARADIATAIVVGPLSDAITAAGALQSVLLHIKGIVDTL